MRVRVVNPIEDETWDSFVLQHPQHSFFHSSAWARTLHESYGYTPYYFALAEDRTLHSALCVMEVHSRLTGRRGISLPFTDACPTLCATPEQARQLRDEAIGYGRQNGWRYLELRGDASGMSDISASGYVEHTLSLTDGTDTLFANLKSSVRRAIRKAQSEGVQVTIENSMSAVRTFYRLNCMTRKAHGLPPQPFYFFQHLHRNALATGNGIVVIALHQGLPIAASLFLHFGKRAIYKYGASDPRHLAARANNAVMWHAIQWYAERGYELLSLGKTKSENSGLLQFKRGWGCKEDRLHYRRYDYNQQAFTNTTDHVSGMHNRIFSMLPTPFSRVVGALLYRHVA